MNVISPPQTPPRFAQISRSQRWLSHAAAGWFVVAMIGQFLFTAYILGLYGVSAIEGDWEQWSSVMPHGYTPGDWAGNLSIGIHLLLAAVVNIGGPIQILPQVRNRWPRFHRYLGRTYIGAGYLISLTGLFLVWVRGSVGGPEGAVSISINGLLIMAFATLTIREARAGNFRSHRKWALRLFLVMSGVWFFRVGLMLWLMVWQAPVGFDPESFRGPFLTFWGLAQYLLPLAVLEAYFWAQEKSGRWGQWGVAAMLGVATVATAAGVLAVSLGMWWG
ncbi:MAG: DUF2306 domain-containing protein [Bacteroidota bacterium]